MTHRARRQDGNHREIRRVLQQCGCDVLDVSALGGLGCDLVVWTPRGEAFAVEVKDGDKAPRQRKLTDSETTLALRMPRHYRVIGSEAEAVALATGVRRPGSPVGHDRTRGQSSERPETSAAPRGAQEGL